MADATITAKILRFDPDKDEKPYYQSYEVPVGRQVTVHELLNIIHRDFDGTLAFRDFKCFRHVHDMYLETERQVSQKLLDACRAEFGDPDRTGIQR